MSVSIHIVWIEYVHTRTPIFTQVMTEEKQLKYPSVDEEGDFLKRKG